MIITNKELTKRTQNTQHDNKISVRTKWKFPSQQKKIDETEIIDSDEHNNISETSSENERIIIDTSKEIKYKNIDHFSRKITYPDHKNTTINIQKKEIHNISLKQI